MSRIIGFTARERQIINAVIKYRNEERCYAMAGATLRPALTESGVKSGINRVRHRYREVLSFLMEYRRYQKVANNNKRGKKIL